MKIEMLIEQLIRLLDKLEFDEHSIRYKFEDELKRFKKFQRTVLGIGNSGAGHDEVDIKTYAKYILKEGTNEEKRELMGCFRSKLKITKGLVTID
jgi:peptidyl-tRNA hydrolase